MHTKQFHSRRRPKSERMDGVAYSQEMTLILNYTCSYSLQVNKNFKFSESTTVFISSHIVTESNNDHKNDEIFFKDCNKLRILNGHRFHLILFSCAHMSASKHTLIYYYCKI